MKKRLKRVYNFLRYNSNRSLYLKILLLSAFYRFSILIIPINVIKKHIGVLGEESPMEESTAVNDQRSGEIAYAVNRVCSQTPWESKCLVRALCVQHLLKKSQIPSTLYLGVGKENGDIIAHAWLRSGRRYLTGGHGDGYTIVAKFRA